MSIKTYYTAEHRPIQLLMDNAKSGGEGSVYSISGDPNTVAKLFSAAKLQKSGESLEKKLRGMCAMAWDPYVKGHLAYTWPQEVIFDSAGAFAGYTMPAVTGAVPLLKVFRESERDKFFSFRFTFEQAVKVAYNLSAVMTSLHERSITIGDFNEKNILVHSTGMVTVIDTDSFGLQIGADSFPCEVVLPTIRAPELAKKKNSFSTSSDCFALAIHVFRLLMGNNHPFGVDKGGSSCSACADDGGSIFARNIRKGYCAYLKGRGPSYAPDYQLLPSYIRDLFERTFDYTEQTATMDATIARRPSAKEWKQALLKLSNEPMEICTANQSHVYPKSYRGGCPWCKAEQHRQKLFTAAIPGGGAPAATKKAAPSAIPVRPAAGAAAAVARPAAGAAVAQPATTSQSSSPAALYVLTLFFSILAAAISVNPALQALYTGADLWINPVWGWLFSLAVAVGVGTTIAHLYTEDLPSAASPGAVFFKSGFFAAVATFGVIWLVTLVLYVIAGLILLLAGILAVIFFARKES